MALIETATIRKGLATFWRGTGVLIDSSGPAIPVLHDPIYGYLHASLEKARKAVPTLSIPILEKEGIAETTAHLIEAKVKETVIKLSQFPSGLNFTDVVFLYTDQSYTGPHGEEGRQVITVNREGQMRKIGAYKENEHEEWDIEDTNSGSVLLSAEKVLRYSIPLLAVVQKRLGVRLNDAAEKDDPARKKATLNDFDITVSAMTSISEYLFRLTQSLGHPQIKPLT